MAQPDAPSSEPSPQFPPQSPTSSAAHEFFRKLFGRQSMTNVPLQPAEKPAQDEQAVDSQVDAEKAGLIRRMSRKVVPGLPRAQTFKRQQSEQRTKLAPVEPTTDERRAVSMDRRSHGPRASSIAQPPPSPRISAPSILEYPPDDVALGGRNSSIVPHTDWNLEKRPDSTYYQDDGALTDDCPLQDHFSTADTHSFTHSQYDAMILDELERTWILNLSMHFRDRSKREKFFVTYRELEHTWRRVTVSLDYRNAPPNSLEMELSHTQYQRDKSAKIYEAIRESLSDIQFYDTVTNLKLQTTDGRLHVHVVEDGNEIIPFPSVSQIRHLGCRRIKERDIAFDSHMSGFVYKVKVNGHTLIKKEIPSPDTIEEFLYEVNALYRLRFSPNVIRFYGVVVDEHDEYVKGLLISYAEQGALIDIIYENCKDGNFDIPWPTRQKWARQIVEGLSDVHESGFVQGDFTLSNIVIDEYGDAKIIDINRRGCPVGWEPPEATALIECNQRISMYIGVKSDLYQLGMVLWALATQEDEPEAQGRPLTLGLEYQVPDWYRQITETCLSDDPRSRLQASSLLQWFPNRDPPSWAQTRLGPPAGPVESEYVLKQYLADNSHAANEYETRTAKPPSDWSYVSRPYDFNEVAYEPYYPPRGRSPPSPLPSNDDRCGSPHRFEAMAAWAANRNIPSSYSDVDPDGLSPDETPTGNKTLLIGPAPALSPPSTAGKPDLSSDLPVGLDEMPASQDTSNTAGNCGGTANTLEYGPELTNKSGNLMDQWKHNGGLAVEAAEASTVSAPNHLGRGKQLEAEAENEKKPEASSMNATDGPGPKISTGSYSRAEKPEPTALAVPHLWEKTAEEIKAPAQSEQENKVPVTTKGITEPDSHMMGADLLSSCMATPTPHAQVEGPDLEDQTGENYVVRGEPAVSQQATSTSPGPPKNQSPKKETEQDESFSCIGAVHLANADQKTMA